MKKYLILAAAAVVALAACSKVDADLSSMPDVKIGFEVANYVNQTKADSHGHLSLKDELEGLGKAAEFQSIAYIHADNGAGGVADPVTFFNAATNGIETVSYGSNKWEPSHTYYWPKAVRSNLDFFSWYDYKYDAGTPSVPTFTLTYPATATLVWTNRAVELKDDILFADAAWHYKNNNDNIHNLDGVTAGVPTLFHHALAQLRFTASVTETQSEDSKNPGYYTFWEVTISDVSVSNVKTTGSLSLSQTPLSDKGTNAWTWTKTNSKDIWTSPAASPLATLTTSTVFNTDAAKGNTILPKTTSVEMLTVANTYMPDNYFTVLPQQVGDDVTLTFKYTVVTKYGTSLATATTISTETINVNDLAAASTPYTATGVKLNALDTNAFGYWEMNKKYTYNIIINPVTATILYDPAVVDWEDGGTASQTVPAA